MNLIVGMPLAARLTAVVAIGACIGAAVNWAVYSLAWNPRPISPWAHPHPSAPRRRFADRLPFVGWLGLRRESRLHGAGFWLRPMLIEILVSAGLAWLYWWEIAAEGLLPPGILQPDQTVLHLQFAAHTVLIALMLAGSLIDVDEMTIPDEITVPGTLLGLVLAAAWPWSLLPDWPGGPQGAVQSFLDLTSPNAWPAWLDRAPQVGSLVVGLGCWSLWCAALLPRTWYTRHGWARAVKLSCARLAREPSTYRILRMALIGGLVIALVWRFRSDDAWTALLSALVGMAASGGLIWLVRVTSGNVLGREAMGFGDVTLMAMLGAFLGWQPCLIIFFLAPMAALAIGVLRLIAIRDRELPFGPFLCLAALFVIVRWSGIWGRLAEFFSPIWFLPLVMLVFLVLMAVMLSAWRIILAAIR